MVKRLNRTIDKIKQVQVLRYKQTPPTFEQEPMALTQRQHLEKRLKNSHFIVAGGAWQHLWDKDIVKQMGFGSTCSTVDVVIPSEEDLRSSIRPELLKRFRNDVVIMPAMTAKDYENSINEFAPKLPSKYRNPFRKSAKENISHAVAQKLGMRYFEDILSNILTSTTKLK